MSTMQAI